MAQNLRYRGAAESTVQGRAFFEWVLEWMQPGFMSRGASTPNLYKNSFLWVHYYGNQMMGVSIVMGPLGPAMGRVTKQFMGHGVTPARGYGAHSTG